MPQLEPFYWLNGATMTLAALVIVTYAVSTYLLPPMLELFVSRSYVTKL